MADWKNVAIADLERQVAELRAERDAQLAETQRAWNERDGEKRKRLAAEKEVERKDVALRRIAEGNLGDASWQADYDKIREVALAALGERP